MESKHTPGPWEAKRLLDGALVVTMPFTDGQPGWVGAEIHATDANPTESVSNARLIAAAPELLEALEAILKECPVGSAPLSASWIRKLILPAIAKARGE